MRQNLSILTVVPMNEIKLNGDFSRDGLLLQVGKTPLWAIRLLDH